jgi:hypothetical protein
MRGNVLGKSGYCLHTFALGKFFYQIEKVLKFKRDTSRAYKSGLSLSHSRRGESSSHCFLPLFLPHFIFLFVIMGNAQASVNGFTWSTTAEQAARGTDLREKNVIVTGGSSGLVCSSPYSFV